VAHESAVGRELTEFLTVGGVADAADFAGELLRDYPLVRRVGVPVVSARLGELGVSPPARAREVALTLLAFEWLGRLPYEQTLGVLEREFAASDALAATLAASALRRRLQGVPASLEQEGARRRLSRLALAWRGGR